MTRHSSELDDHEVHEAVLKGSWKLRQQVTQSLNSASKPTAASNTWTRNEPALKDSKEVDTPSKYKNSADEESKRRRHKSRYDGKEMQAS